MAKNTICLWYDKDAEAAARFYAETFPDSAVGAIFRAPGDYPSGKKGDVLMVEFKVAGVSCIGLNGGPAFKHNEAFSFQIATDDQSETDRYWNAIVGNGGQESACGWCKDKWGVSWQITPRVLTEALAAGGDEAKRAFDAMMTMKKIDVAAIKAARRAEFRGREVHDGRYWPILLKNSITANREQLRGRSRSGLISNIRAVVNIGGLPVRFGLTLGEVHDNRLCWVVMAGLEQGSRLLADRGYDADWIRALHRARRVGMIPAK